MSEKTVSVRLKAVVDSYKNSMKEAGKATEEVARSDRWADMGKKTAELGSSLTQKLTLPIVGVGVAAVKMSMDMDSTMVQMQTLAGATAGEVESLRDEVLDLAGETGRGPAELSEALFFLKSAGLSATDAMDALTVSAKASAIGMGSTIQIADAVSSAMNAYAESGLTAAEATDVLIETARQGKVEPAELAAQMGRLLPISSELGITFNDVGAGLAALSLKGGDASQTATTLAGIMAKLLKPSQQGAEAMEAVGISLDDVRSMIADKGLLGTLETLRTSLGDVGFTQMMEDQEAIRGALALTGGDVEKYRGIFDELSDSVGATDAAFATWGESLGAQNAKAWGELQATLVRLGDVLAGPVTDGIAVLSDLLQWFTKLPGSVKAGTGAVVLFLAALGPMLSVIGNVQRAIGGGMKVADWARNLDTATQSADGMTTSMGKLKNAAVLGGVVAAVAGIGLAVKAHFDQKNREAIAGMAEGFASMGDEITDSFGQEKIQQLMKWEQVDKVFKQLLDTNVEAAKRFIEGAEAAGVQKTAIEEMEAAIENKADADAQAAKDSEAAADGATEAAGAFDLATTAITDAVTALGDYAAALQAQFDPLFGLVDALQGNKDAQDAVAEATHNLNEARRIHGQNSDEAKTAEEELNAAMLDTGRSAVDVMVATAGLNAAIAENPALLGEAKGSLEQWVQAGLLTQEQAAHIARQFDLTAERARVLGQTDPTISVTTTGVATAMGQMETLRQKYDGATFRTRIEVAVDKGGVNIGGGVKLRALGGPVYRGEGYVVGEKGPEWFEPDVSGRIVPNHMLSSSLVPHSAVAGGGGGGAAPIFVTMDMRGAVISSRSDFVRMVAAAWNQAAASNTVHVRGRPL
jgi:TP901 family phage tail tape measure protein